VADSVKDTFDNTVLAYETMLSDAETLLQTLTGYKIRGQMRDFSEIVDANRAALEVIKVTRGPMLRRHWASL
jgi:hypothetical protein